MHIYVQSLQSPNFTMNSRSFFSHDAHDDIVSCFLFVSSSLHILHLLYFQFLAWQSFMLHHLSLLRFYLSLIHYFYYFHHHNNLVNIVTSSKNRTRIMNLRKNGTPKKRTCWKRTCRLSPVTWKTVLKWFMLTYKVGCARFHFRANNVWKMYHSFLFWIRQS